MTRCYAAGEPVVSTQLVVSTSRMVASNVVDDDRANPAEVPRGTS